MQEWWGLVPHPTPNLIKIKAGKLCGIQLRTVDLAKEFNANMLRN